MLTQRPAGRREFADDEAVAAPEGAREARRATDVAQAGPPGRPAALRRPALLHSSPAARPARGRSGEPR